VTNPRISGRRVFFHREVVVACLVALLLFVIGSFIVSGFASIANVRTILTLASFIGIAAAGQTTVVITGGIDLSNPWVMASSALLLGVLAHSDGSLVWAIPVVLAYGAGIGAINGLGVAFFGVSPIIMTLAMNTILTGFASVINAQLAVNVPNLITNLSSNHVGPFTVDVFIWVVVGLVVLAYLTLTVRGRSIYSIGSNIKVARFSGMRVQSSLVSAYVVSGVMAVCAGIMVAGYGAQAYGGLGDPYLFTSIAAVAIGGVSIYGGSGSYTGAAAGALIIALLSAILVAKSLGPAVLDVVYGAVIIGAMLLIRMPSANIRLRLTRRSQGPTALNGTSNITVTEISPTPQGGTNL